MKTKMKQAFGRVGHGKKLHFAYVIDGDLFRHGDIEKDEWQSGCLNHGGDYIGKPISRLVEVVEFDGQYEALDDKRAVEALKEKRPYLKDQDICNWCFYARWL